MFLRTKSNGKHTYLQLVESARDRSLADGFPSRVLGPALVFEPLWHQTGCRDALRAALASRRFQFDVERAVFLTVLHRLIAPGSDRQAVRWMSDHAVDGADSLELQHFYCAMAWLGEELPDAEQRAGRTLPEPTAARSPRYVKDELEEDLFARRRDLFTGLDLVFFDTTSHYFHGAGGGAVGEAGQVQGRLAARQAVRGADAGAGSGAAHRALRGGEPAQRHQKV